MTDDAAPRPRPFAGWIALASGLVALGCALWVLLAHDVVTAFTQPPVQHPVLMAALIQGIIGTLAGIVALVRGEPRRLAVIGLVLSAFAILAKFVLAALAVGIVLAIVLAVMSQVS